MALVQITSKDSESSHFLNLGFRPFFLGASVFSILSLTLWILVYLYNLPLTFAAISNSQWHSHEMIYGYTVAVIAGFLLTAINNWTGVKTLNGPRLLMLFALWAGARVLFFFGTDFIQVCAVLDMLFIIALFIALAHPIVITKQWKQAGVLTKVLLLGLGNLCFYLGAFGRLDQGVYWSIYGGLYIIIALILTIGSRVMPAFIANGVDYKVEIKNPRWIAVSSLVLFIPFFVTQLFLHNQTLLGYTSITLFGLNTLRLYHWHTKGIWKKPLLWALYLSFVFIDLGFLLFALNAFIGFPYFVAVHAFAVGGIGLATLSMMARVTLGHTGRSIKNPPKVTGIMLLILLFSAVLRVVVLSIKPGYYGMWILSSQVLWSLAFGIYLFTHGRMLVQKDLS